jgi:hypothetical protein
MVEDPQKLDKDEQKTETFKELSQLISENELILISIPLFFNHLKIEFKHSDFNQVFGVSHKQMCFRKVGQTFRIENYIKFISTKHEEEITRFGGNFEEKDFEQIRLFLEKCSDLKILVSKGNEQFKKIKSKFFWVLGLINRFLSP